MTMNSTRRGFLIRGAAVGGAALVRRVVTALAGRSTAAYAVVGGPRPTQFDITHGAFVGHLTSTTAMVWAKSSTVATRPGTKHVRRARGSAVRGWVSRHVRDLRPSLPRRPEIACVISPVCGILTPA